MTDDKPPKPDKPCPVCNSTDWYWPGDYYVGKKRWLCGQCHPEPGKEMKE